jgi:hypothetical protein
MRARVPDGQTNIGAGRSCCETRSGGAKARDFKFPGWYQPSLATSSAAPPIRHWRPQGRAQQRFGDLHHRRPRAFHQRRGRRCRQCSFQSCSLSSRHGQQTTQLVDLAGQTECLSLQHAYRVASVPLFDQFGDTLVESSQFAKQSVKLLLNRRPPSLLAGVQSCVRRSGFFCAHGSLASKSHADFRRKSGRMGDAPGGAQKARHPPHRERPLPGL